MNLVERWPMDYDELRKGDIIPAERVERIVGIKQSAGQAYQLALLSLTSQIAQELGDRGRNWTLKTERGGIHILTDAEASTYNHREAKKARRAMLRRHQLNLSVDVGALNEDQRKQHDRIIEIDGKYVQAMFATRKELQLQAHRRSTPALNGQG